MSAVLMGVADLAAAYLLSQVYGDIQGLLAMVLFTKGLMSIFAPR